jgi:hypothetical protein
VGIPVTPALIKFSYATNYLLGRPTASSQELILTLGAAWVRLVAIHPDCSLEAFSLDGPIGPKLRLWPNFGALQGQIDRDVLISTET